jgi:[ribosomal protein S18]-alanine N-acetyltransferase
MLVARIEQHDRDAVAAIAELSGIDIDVGAELDRKWARIDVARLATGPSEPIAFVLSWWVADEVHVISVATHPNLRRRGAAALLLRMLIEQARSDRARHVLLEVRRSNHAAIRLYRSQGFSAMGVRRAYYADNSEDAIEMMLAIDPATGLVVPGRDEIELEA